MQVHLCRTQTPAWLFLSPSLWHLLPLLHQAPILCSHEPRPVFSKLTTRRTLVLWTPLAFFLLFLHPLSLKDSNLLLRILHGLLPWMKKFKPCKAIILGSWSHDLPTPTLWAQNGCFGPNTCPMDLSSVSKLVLLPRATHRYLVLTTLTLLEIGRAHV